MRGYVCSWLPRSLSHSQQGCCMQERANKITARSARSAILNSSKGGREQKAETKSGNALFLFLWRCQALDSNCFQMRIYRCVPACEIEHSPRRAA